MSTWLGDIGDGSWYRKVQGALPDRHPFEVCSDSVHLALVNTDLGAVIEERILSVTQTAEAIAIAVVGNFVVIPDVDPGEVLVGGRQILVGPVLSLR